jgi:hypothetical protein
MEKKNLILKFGSFFNKKGEYWNKIFKYSHILAEFLQKTFV